MRNEIIKEMLNNLSQVSIQKAEEAVNNKCLCLNFATARITKNSNSSLASESSLRFGLKNMILTLFKYQFKKR